MRPRITALAAVVAFALMVATVAVLAARSGDDHHLVKLPIGAMGGAEDAAGAPSARSGMWAPYGLVEYRLAGPLRELPSTGPAYRLGSTATAAEVRRLAEILGMDGELEEERGAWVVRSGARELRVQHVPGAPWHLGPVCTETAAGSDAPDKGAGVSCAYAQGSVGGVVSPEAVPAVPVAPSTVVACDAGADCVEPHPGPVPEPPPRPAGLPTRGQAEDLARSLFARLGVGTDGFGMDDGWATWEAHVEPRVDGWRVFGLWHGLSIGPKGQVVGASGFLGRPELIGDYPLAGLDRGLVRGEAGFGPRPLAVDLPSGAEPAEPPPPVVRTIVGAYIALQQVDDKLVPVYVFEFEDGSESFPVPAVTDEWLQQQVPPATEAKRD